MLPAPAVEAAEVKVLIVLPLPVAVEPPAVDGGRAFLYPSVNWATNAMSGTSPIVDATSLAPSPATEEADPVLALKSKLLAPWVPKIGNNSFRMS